MKGSTISVVTNLPANAGNARDSSSIPGSGRSPEVVNGNPFQYSCQNPMERGAWQATVHGGFKESDTTEHTHTQNLKSKNIR